MTSAPLEEFVVASNGNRAILFADLCAVLRVPPGTARRYVRSDLLCKARSRYFLYGGDVIEVSEQIVAGAQVLRRTAAHMPPRLGHLAYIPRGPVLACPPSA